MVELSWLYNVYLRVGLFSGISDKSFYKESIEGIIPDHPEIVCCEMDELGENISRIAWTDGQIIIQRI